MRAFAAVILALSLSACGGDSKKTPDASQADAPKTIDAQNCDPGTVGTFDYVGPFEAMPPSATWDASLTGVGGGSALDYQIQIYGGVESSLSGTFDLSMGKQANFSSCAICVMAFSKDTDTNGNPARAFFQKSGSIMLSQDPLASSHLMGTISNLELQEVTIDWPTATHQGDYTSTPVANGACGSVASQQLDHDGVPNAYTCTHTGWLDGTSCDCNCGAEDPDCYSGSNAIPACTTGQICKASACVTGPTNDTCAAAGIPLTLGTAVTGTTAGAHNDYDMGLEGATCTGFAQPGSDVAYVVTLTAATQYTIALTNVDAAYDASVALVGPGAATVCGATITTCVGGADAMFEGGDESFTYTPTTTGTYYVIVDSESPPGLEGGAFTLTVSAM